MSGKALLIIDMSNDLLLKRYNSRVAFERGLELIPGIRRLEEAFLDRGYPVIFVTDRHLPSDIEVGRWGPHSMKGSMGSEIVDGLVSVGRYVLERGWREGDVINVPPGQLLYDVEKGNYGGFIDDGGVPTALESLLRRLGLGSGDKLYFSGIHTACCVKHTVGEAWIRGYLPVVVADCVDSYENVGGRLGMGHREALRYMSQWYGAEVKDLDMVLDDL
jgi:nicotinamidase-related amidase